ncbi:MAG: hypothetical protein ACUVRO_04205, partial [Armatimonadota bacterium]
AVGGYNGNNLTTNEEYDPPLIVMPVKSGDVVYHRGGGQLKVGSQSIPANAKTTVSADGDLILSSGKLEYAWVQRP